MISERTTSIPMPRPETCVTFDAVENPGWKMHSMSCASLGCASGAIRPCATAFALTPSRLSPAPSSASSIAISFATCRTVNVISPVSDFPAFARWPRASMPWSSALRNRCSSGPTSFSSTARSSSVCAPRISRLARLPSSRAVPRRIRYKRSDRLPNGTVRIENSCCCTSRASLPCALSAASATSRFFRSDWCTVETSLTPSPSERASSWNRVYRSNSSGSKPSSPSPTCMRRDWICDSAWISISRTCVRRRMTLPVSSSRFVLSARSSLSMRARAIDTSPASFTSRSMMSARTRSIARAPASASTASVATRSWRMVGRGQRHDHRALRGSFRLLRGAASGPRRFVLVRPRQRRRWSCLRAAHRERRRYGRGRRRAPRTAQPTRGRASRRRRGATP